jgi:hypothetical protein
LIENRKPGLREKVGLFGCSRSLYLAWGEVLCRIEARNWIASGLLNHERMVAIPVRIDADQDGAWNSIQFLTTASNSKVESP